MTFEVLILLVLVFVLISVLPCWSYSRWWGYGPAVLIGLIFIVLLAMTLTGRIPGRQTSWSRVGQGDAANSLVKSDRSRASACVRVTV
jgi:Protein of unknown function (DUF3309)